ncbi:RelA/SpoT domain-containing protein [Methylotetracoccus oryzae]|uniref:RelA/SpoT domain-containing protein n=1 Tax=Methylotetracoccus oryzae TaxID=1919059 RepID=UPI00111B7CBD|nr:RelA/SpoT domain-containing protein [Methylotetracoccus oryzae]
MELEAFLYKNRISEDDWKKAEIPFEELLRIESDYRLKVPHLNESAEFLVKVLQKCDQVHSVRWRVKDPEHVLEKIVRKKASASPKYKNVSVENYAELITDLVGVRVLHLFKNEWLEIHHYIKESWVPVEAVVAYIREGDEGVVVESYRENGCDVQTHSAGYRSVHYIISMQPTLKKIISEIQVRTIFEEGWSEIDHKVRYRNFMDNKLVSYFLTIFNRLSGSADEMGTFVNDLVADIKWKDLQLDVKQKEQIGHLSKIEELAQELSKEKSENKSKESSLRKLKEEIESVRKNSIEIPDISKSKSLMDEINTMTALSREALKFSRIGSLNSAQLEAIKLSDMTRFSSAYDDVLNSMKKIDKTKLLYDPISAKATVVKRSKRDDPDKDEK